MFSPEIVGSEEFKTMPMSSQALYFHLGMDADDDGFIQPKLLMRAIGFTDDDLKVLLAKRFLLEFGNGVVVIKHWLIHNMIRTDRYKPTRYIEEKKLLFIKDNKAYTDRKPIGLHSGNQMAPQVRLGKDRLLSDSGESEDIVSVPEGEEDTKVRKVKTTQDMKDVFALFTDNPARVAWKLREVERNAAQQLFVEFGLETLRKRYAIVQKYRDDAYCPQINSPSSFLDKMSKMESFLKRLKRNDL